MEAAGRKFQYLPDLVILDTLPFLSFADLASTYVAGDERMRYFCARTHVLKKASIQELASVYSVGKQSNCDTLKSLCLRPSVLKKAVSNSGYSDSRIYFSHLVKLHYNAPEEQREFYSRDKWLNVTGREVVGSCEFKLGPCLRCTPLVVKK